MKDYDILNLKDLYYTDFALTDILVVRQKRKEGVLFQRSTPKERTGLIFLNNCVVVYTDKSGESFTASGKSIVCLPYSSEYKCLDIVCENTLNDAIIVEFNIVKDGKILTLSDKPFLIKDINVPVAIGYFESAVKSYEASSPSPLAIKASVYNLLSYLCKEKVKMHQKRFSQIGAGIELLESDIFCKLSIEEIAKICKISTCYFRRLFKEYSGKSPLEYRMDMRINLAKKILESDETTVEYIAEYLNFESSSYFCKIFKKKEGVTPSQYRKNKIKKI